MTGAPATAIVLVHGGFLGGWCWVRVGERLAAQGFRVFAPTLAGLGERADLLGPDIDLSHHIAEIVELIVDEDLHHVVLCGHSYGGMVISGVAACIASRLRALVYLDAILPEPGRALWDYLSDTARAAFDAATVGDAILPGKATLAMVNTDDAAWVDALSTPHPRATLTEPLPESAAHAAIPINIYVFAGRYGSPMLRRCADRAVATPGWQRVDLPYGHNLMIDAPDEVSAILAGATGSA